MLTVADLMRRNRLTHAWHRRMNSGSWGQVGRCHIYPRFGHRWFDRSERIGVQRDSAGLRNLRLHGNAALHRDSIGRNLCDGNVARIIGDRTRGRRILSPC